MKKVLSLAVLALACGSSQEASRDEAWVRFEERATRVVEGRVMYVVEWDLAVSHDELRAYYDAHLAPVGKVERPLVVNTVNGRDDLWSEAQRFNLSYCVSNTFGSMKDRVVSEMWSATAAWEGAANVRFVYNPTQDGNCSNTNPNVLFAVQPWVGDGACAFFPSGGGCVGRTLVINYQDFPDTMTIGVLRHELGHVLGFRHEHIRPESGFSTVYGCNDGGGGGANWRALTAYDRPSIMHYPQCNGVPSTLDSPWALTALDRQGAASLYGAGSTPPGTHAIDLPEFFIRQVYRDVLKRDPDAAGFNYYLGIFQSCNGDPACLASQRVAFALGMFESAENRQQDPELSPASAGYNAAFITHCYTNFLRRQPTAAEHSWWLNTLNTTGDYSTTLKDFITSAEYRQRFGAQ